MCKMETLAHATGVCNSFDDVDYQLLPAVLLDLCSMLFVTLVECCYICHMQDLPEGIDPCGENGEFHTFVFDGPMFDSVLDIQVGDKLSRDGFCFCDIVPPGMSLAAAAAEVAAAAAAAAAKKESLDDSVTATDGDDHDCKKMVQLALQQRQQQRLAEQQGKQQ